MSSERLQKILAQAGIASRRAAEKYITEGRVRVNGEVVALGAKADPSTDTIEIDGMGAIEPEPIVYIVLHKPIHVVTTVSDPEKRQTVIDVLGMSRAEGPKTSEGNMPRIFPVGRLDFDAEGLLVLTNDGALANDLLHPRYHVPKTYVVKVRGRPDDRHVDRLRRGVRLREEDGRMSRPTAKADVNIVRESPSNTWLEMIIVEGRHHQVKRMCEAVGHQVIRLIRTEFGGIELGELEPGQWRFLTEGEVELLRSWRAGNASELLSARRGPTMTERLFGAKPGRGTSKRSGAPRERSGAPRERSSAGRGASGAPRERSGAPRERTGAQGERSGAPRERSVYRADRGGEGEGGGRPIRRDAAPRSAERAGRSDRAAPRGDRPAPRGDRPSRGAPRRDAAPLGAFRASRGDSKSTGRGSDRRVSVGAHDETPVRRSGSPRPGYGGMSPRGDSATRGPRRESGDGRKVSPRVDSRGEARGPRRDDARLAGRPSRGAPRGDFAPRGDRPQRGAPRGDFAPRGDRPQRGAPRGDFAPRGDRPQRGAPRGDFAPRGDRPMRGAPRSEGRAPARGGDAPRGDRPQRSFTPRAEGRPARGGPKSAPRGPSAGHRRGGPGRHH